MGENHAKEPMKTNTRILLACCLFWLGTSPGGWCFYNPTTGRWLSRDPIGERGGRNLYGLVGNSPIATIDPVGKAVLKYVGDGFQFVPWPSYACYLGFSVHFSETEKDFIGDGAAFMAHEMVRVSISTCDKKRHANRSSGRFYLDRFSYDRKLDEIHHADYSYRLTDGHTRLYFNPLTIMSASRFISYYDGNMRSIGLCGTRGVLEVEWVGQLLPKDFGAYSTFSKPKNYEIIVYPEADHMPSSEVWPSEWSYMNIVATYSMRFEWDDCDGQKMRSFWSGPTLDPGPQRWDRTPASEGGVNAEIYR